MDVFGNRLWKGKDRNYRRLRNLQKSISMPWILLVEKKYTNSISAVGCSQQLVNTFAIMCQLGDDSGDGIQGTTNRVDEEIEYVMSKGDDDAHNNIFEKDNIMIKRISV